MSERFARSIVFFDLPTVTLEDRRSYNKFRKALIKNGFIMLQESVYCRLITTENAEKTIDRIIELNKPKDGIVHILRITEKQFAKIKFLVGESTSDIIDSDERIVIL